MISNNLSGEFENESKEKKDHSIFKLDLLNVESKITIADDEKIEINSDSTYKRKTSLLKRTASEPKLIQTESVEDLSTEEEKTVKLTKVSNQPSKATKIKNSSLHNKTKNKSIIDETDSSYDEIYFYNFENLLVDYINKKYMNKIDKI